MVELYFRIKLLEIMSKAVRFPSKKELLAMPDGNFKEYREDLKRLEAHLDEVNICMWKAYRAYNQERLRRRES